MFVCRNDAAKLAIETASSKFLSTHLVRKKYASSTQRGKG